jgi:hypothetical protein
MARRTIQKSFIRRLVENVVALILLAFLGLIVLNWFITPVLWVIGLKDQFTFEGMYGIYFVICFGVLGGTLLYEKLKANK